MVSLLDAGLPEDQRQDRRGVAASWPRRCPRSDAAHIAHEAADLIFHTLVGLEAAGVPIDAVFAELRRRFGVSGIDEKASRKK